MQSAAGPSAAGATAVDSPPPKAGVRAEFQLLRYFSIASAIAVLLVTLVISWAHYREEVNDQVDATEARNAVLARIVANSVWPAFGAYLVRQGASPAGMQAEPRTAELHEALRAITRRVPVIKIKIYNIDGIATYSSVLGEIGEDKSANQGFRAARSGRTVSELTHRGEISASERKIENIDVVSTYIPIATRGERIDAVFELYSDVTEVLLEIRRSSLRLMAGLVVTFALLYGTLLLIVAHADRILRQQYREIRTSQEQIHLKNQELQSEIATRLAVEDALRKSEQTAGDASRAKTDFLSSMSHELRTPMNAILGFAQLLQSEPAAPLSREQDRFVDQILKAGRHLLDLINEVLDLASIEAGKIKLSVEPVAVATIVAECVQMVQNMAREKSVRISVAPPEEELRVLADYIRLKQSLLNLLSNAIKYNRKDGQVSVSVEALGEQQARISVADTGMGIPQDRQGELFRPFHRLGLDAGEVEGTGIGLTLTRNLVEAMGGEIAFSSTWGTGSTFWIALPRDRRKAAAPESAAAIAELPGAAGPTEAERGERRHCVLYVEDNPANVLLMEHLAARMSLRFLSAHNGELGISLAASEKPDLIIMDINLPQMDGYEALARLRQDPATASIPVIALSANAMDKDVARGIAAGFVQYQTKPVDVEKISRSIRRILDGKR